MRRLRAAAASTGACFVVGLQGIRARPLRSLLAMTSLVLGVVAVVCVAASSAVAERAVVARAELASGRAPTYPLDASPGSLPTLRAAVEHALGPGRGAGAVVVESRGIFGHGDDAAAVVLRAVEGNLRSVKPFPVRSGRWLDGGYSSGLAVHLVLNEKAAKPLREAAAAPDFTITGSSETAHAVVVGVVDDAGDEGAAYVRLDEALRWAPHLVTEPQTQLLVHEGSDAAIRTTVSRRIEAAGFPAPQFQRSDQVDSLTSSVGAIRNVFVFIAAVALLVGVIAVLNTGLATIGERVDELALRRAVGTTPRMLGAIVLAEAILVGTCAAAAALAVSAPLLEPVSRMLFPDLPADESVAFPMVGAMIGVAGSGGAAIAGGLVPALRAARIPIASVMRA